MNCIDFKNLMFYMGEYAKKVGRVSYRAYPKNLRIRFLFFASFLFLSDRLVANAYSIT